MKRWKQEKLVTTYNLLCGRASELLAKWQICQHYIDMIYLKKINGAESEY